MSDIRKKDRQPFWATDRHQLWWCQCPAFQCQIKNTCQNTDEYIVKYHIEYNFYRNVFKRDKFS